MWLLPQAVSLLQAIFSIHIHNTSRRSELYSAPTSVLGGKNRIGWGQEMQLARYESEQLA